MDAAGAAGEGAQARAADVARFLQGDDDRFLAADVDAADI
jgi:hypothetical protein